MSCYVKHQRSVNTSHCRQQTSFTNWENISIISRLWKQFYTSQYHLSLLLWSIQSSTINKGWVSLSNGTIIEATRDTKVQNIHQSLSYAHNKAHILPQHSLAPSNARSLLRWRSNHTDGEYEDFLHKGRLVCGVGDIYMVGETLEYQ